MAQQQNAQDSENLELVSDELNRSLERCQTIVEDYRSKLAANSNALIAANGEPEDQGRIK